MTTPHNAPIRQSLLQEFGFLIVTDIHLNIVGISERALSLIRKSADQVLGASVEEYYSDAFEHLIKRHLPLLHLFISKKTPKQVLLDKIDGKKHYFNFSKSEEYIYIEWEKQTQKQISATKMTGLGYLFERSYFNDWNMVCKAVNDLLGYDQVVVFQVQDGGQGKAIAEYRPQGPLEYLGKEVSNLLYSQEVSSFYESLSYRYIPNFGKQKQNFYSKDKDTIDLLCSQLAPLPKLHKLYLQYKKIEALVCFPLFMGTKFWGGVVAYSNTPKKIDRQSRKLCSFIVQNSMRKFENVLTQEHLEYKERVHHANITIAERLQEMPTPNCAMVDSMGLLTKTIGADGMAIYHHGDVFFHNLSPTENQFHQIITFLQKHNKKRIFKDHNFRLNRHSHIDGKLPFAGLLAYCVDLEKEHYLIWFRKEVVSTVLNLNKFYNRTSADFGNKEKLMIEEKIADSAIPWDENEIYFVENLHHLITESIVSKTREQEALTESLRNFNTELEMLTYTLSHDLKNPLSILKMGLQFLQNSSAHISAQKRASWYRNMLESVDNIEDIINNTVELSQSRTEILTKDPTPMASKIHRICKEACLIHDSKNCQFHFGQLFPIWGEKSTLYQVFLNLITNAVKYSSSKPEPQVWIHSEENNGEIFYTIRDNGIGIPSQHLPHIFKKFARAENATKFKGTGIGLALVKRIIERLEGEINIYSQENEGTRVVVRFPVVSDFPPSMLKN